MEYDFLIVGAGLYGSTFARIAADSGKRVLVVDKRNEIGGNVFTEEVNGIYVHRYGAHIFHTSNECVWSFVNKFARFNSFVNSPVANYKGEIYSLPFNMNTFQKMWGVTEPEEARSIINKQIKDAGITAPHNLEEQAISLVGTDIYEKLIKGYTEKQWGRKCSDLPAFIIKRIPVRFTYNNNYFNDIYQGIPEDGYTEMVKSMLTGIEVHTGVDYLSHRVELNSLANTVVFTGPVDEFYDYAYGHLEYRSLRFETETLDLPDFQGNAVVNYTDDVTPFTRIIEHKWFIFGKDKSGTDIPKTITTKEYPVGWKPGLEPFYPVNDEKNSRVYSKYKELADKEKNIVLGGRLGEYKYYDMDKTIEAAMNKAKEIL